MEADIVYSFSLQTFIQYDNSEIHLSVHSFLLLINIPLCECASVSSASRHLGCSSLKLLQMKLLWTWVCPDVQWLSYVSDDV